MQDASSYNLMRFGEKASRFDIFRKRGVEKGEAIKKPAEPSPAGKQTS